MPDPANIETRTDLPPIPVGAADRPEPASARVRVELAAATDRGKKRANNEDHYLAVRFGRAVETIATNLAVGQVPDQYVEVGYGMAVADGMGGTAAGEVASSLALEIGLNLALNSPKWTLRMSPEEICENMERWRQRFRQIDHVLTDTAKSHPSLAGMGTTLTVACSVGPHLVLYYVGDSRAYLFREGRLYRLTRDHTQAQALADQGRIAPEDVARHRFRHVLTRVVGRGGGAVEADVEYVRLTDSDRLLLCTDGLTDMVPDDRIAEALRGIETSHEAAHTLIDMALEAGGKDNVTVVMARYTIPEQATRDSTAEE
ncbi:MAG TPA: protein phosphatase 2C domain-containing protein [Gemmataceae bacterium]|nr:protein phosphatase 2C domain-containing protein [Gemmataceae bacterium]